MMLIPGMIVRHRFGVLTWSHIDLDAHEKGVVFASNRREHKPENILTVIGVFRLKHRKEMFAMIYDHNLETFAWCWEASNWEILVRPARVPRARPHERANKKGTSEAPALCKDDVDRGTS